MDTKTDILGAYARAIDQAKGVVAGVRPDQMENQTPCPKWDTRALLNHFVGSNLMMGTVGTGGSIGDFTSGPEAVAAMGDVVGDDPASAYATASSGALAAFSAPGAMEETWKLPFGDVPGSLALQVHLMETLTHTWDLAKSTDQLSKLDQSLGEPGLDAARGIVSPAARNEAGDPFGPEVAVPEGAPPYDRLAGFMGRTP